MKIARVYSTFQVDFKYTEHYLAEALSKDGHQTTFITSDKYLGFWKKYLRNYDPAGTYQYDFYEVIRLPAYFPLEKTIFKNLKKLNNLLFKSDYDVLHLYGLGSISTLQVLFLSLLNGKHSPPVIISDHTSPDTHKRSGVGANLYHFFISLILQLFKRRIHKIISFSSVGVSVLENRFRIKKKKFSVIPLGYNEHVFRHQPELRNTHDKMILGYAGKIEPKKRLEMLIEVLNESSFFHAIKLIIVGMNEDDNYCLKIKALAEKSNLEIELRPFADPDELALFYNTIDVAVFPGSISITTIEANGCGAPIILYRSIEGLESRVENKRGILFESRSELISAINRYYEQYQNKNLDHKSIADVTKRASSWSNLKDRYLSVMNQAIAPSN